MNLESEAGTRTTAGRADDGAQAESQGREPVLRDRGAGAPRPEHEVEQPVAKDFRSRWNEIQVAFVDEPRDAVGRADQLVAETIQKLSESFTAERQKLEGEWDRGANDSTEALRLALQRYRSFFNRLLSV
jgi:hypothetical protein